MSDLKRHFSFWFLLEFSVISVSAGHQFAVNRWNPGYTGGKERSGAQETGPAQSQGGAGAGSFVLFYLVFITKMERFLHRVSCLDLTPFITHLI